MARKKAATQVRRLLPLLPPLIIDASTRAEIYTPTKTIDVRGAVAGGKPAVELSMEHASTLTLTLHDPDGKLWRNPVMAQPMTFVYGKGEAPRYVRQWRLWRSRGMGSIAREGTSTVLTFWDAGSGALKLRTTPLTRPAGNMNLAGWVEFLADDAKTYYTLTPVVPRPNSTPPRDTDQPDDETTAGFSPGNKAKVTVKGRPASSDQLKEIDTALKRAVKERAPARATWAMVTAGIGESSFQAIMNLGGSPYGGVFQGKAKERGGPWNITDTDGMAQSFLRGGKGFQAGGAISLARENPGMTPGTIATKVEASGKAGSWYDVYAPEARRIIELWSGRDLAQWSQVTGASDTFSSGTDDEAATDARPSEWRRGRPDEPESSLKAMARIAEGLGRRSFVAVNRWVVARDQDLILAAPHLSMTLIDDPMLVARPSIKANETIGLQVHADAWSAPPGAVVEITDSGAELERFWLVSYVRTASNDTVEVQLQQPTTKIPSGNGSSKVDRDDQLTGTGAQVAVEWARRRLDVREVGSNNGPAVREIITDNGGTVGQPWCGYFCRGALRAAGLNPSVSMASVQWIYDTSGRSGDVFKGRTKGSQAKPGDLAVLYGTGTHVGLVEKVVGGTVHTIEGNTSTPNGGQGVARKQHSASSIVAIAQVDYASARQRRETERTGNTPSPSQNASADRGGGPRPFPGDG